MNGASILETGATTSTRATRPSGGEDTDTDSGLGQRLPTLVRKPRKLKVRRVRRKERYRRRDTGPTSTTTRQQGTAQPNDDAVGPVTRAKEERERLRARQRQQRVLARGLGGAPGNTNQFLMEDNNGTDNFLRQMERKLMEKRGQLGESTEEEAHSDRDDFIRTQFQADYKLSQVHRLEKMSKELLLNEYMLLERRNETLEEKLEFIRGQEEEKARRGLVDYDFFNGEIPMDPATAEKIKIFQQEIERLQIENMRLHSENSEMKARLEESSDSSSSSSSSSSSDEDDDYSDQHLEKNMFVPIEDKGYESTKSMEASPGL